MEKNWSGNWRAPWHDYTQPRIYHITLMKHPEVMTFGELAGDWRLPRGVRGRSFIEASPLGKIVKSCLRELHLIDGGLRLFQYALMPDHLHMLLSVESVLDEPLGYCIGEFKHMVNRRAGITPVFAHGFNDQILSADRNLQTIYDYLRDNPYRLAVRRANPNFFSRVNNVEIAGRSYEAYGNLLLLSNPFKRQVVVHRADSPQKRAADRSEWLHTAANGGVLVSPFISRAEREVRSAAEGVGGRTILVVDEALGERFKPCGVDFALCTEGRGLIVSLGGPGRGRVRREMCLRMNGVAAAIACGEATQRLR